MLRAMNVRFKVAVPTHNAIRWIGRCLDSIASQTYDRFACMVVDDCSSDGTMDAIADHPVMRDPRFGVMRTRFNGGALASAHLAFHALDSNADDVYVTVDGDDWLATPDAFAIVAEAYRDRSLLLTYGDFVEHPTGAASFVRAYPPDVIAARSFRSHPFLASHLRTCRARLWHAVRSNDLIDPVTRRIFHGAGDFAMSVPMLEMAGPRQLCIREVLYVYNRANQQSDSRTRLDECLRVERAVRAMPRYDLLASEREQPARTAPTASVPRPTAAPATASRVAGRRPRIGIATPWLERYGLDQWVSALATGLMAHADRVELVGIAVTGPNVVQSTVDRVASIAPVTRGAGSFSMLARECDVLIVSSMPQWTALLPNGMPPSGCRVVLVSHCAEARYQSDIAMPDRAAGIVAVSRAAVGGVPPELSSRVTVVHSGVDLARLDTPGMDRRALRAAWGVPHDARLVGYIGRVSADKDPLALARAIAALPASWRGVAIGPDHGSLVGDMIATSNGRVATPGPTDEIGAALAAMDVLLVPAQHEGFGLAVVEGWACGVPVVAVQTGVAAERPDLVRMIPPLASGGMLAKVLEADNAASTVVRVSQARAAARTEFSAEAFGGRWADYAMGLVT